MDEQAQEKLIESLRLDMVLQSVRLAICVTDPNQDDNPIVYVNRAFLDLTGYDEEEVLGRNCRFLQGPNTTTESIAAVRSLTEGNSLSTVDIINYRKDGTEFINSLQIGPVLDTDNERMLMFGSQIDVTAQRAQEAEVGRIATREIVHRIKNMASVMSSIMRTTARETTDMDDFVESAIGRLHALTAAHVAMLDDQNSEAGSTIALSKAIVANYAPDPAQLTVAGDALVLPGEALTPLSLTLHELATNSVKYGALSCSPGRVTITWTDASADGPLEMVWHEQYGPEVDAPDRAGGSQLIARLLERVGASVTYDWQPQGLIARIALPA